ncbi:MAG: hypothetical protein GXO22_07080 [Aquificae bacterium]|nr:hypothetical protein [Aquificota bacterium]
MKRLGYLLFSLGFVANSYSITYEYPYLFKDPRVIGMGGAVVAVGGYPNAVFYNPAGLSNIPISEGFAVNLFDINVSTNENATDFLTDLLDALDTPDLDEDGDDGDDKLKAVNEVLKAYYGKNIHFYGNDYSSVSRKFSKLAFTIGFLVSIKADGQTHQGFGSEGILELDYNSMVGIVTGLSYDFFDGALSLGVSGKYIYRNGLVHTFTARELVEHENDLDTYITQELAVSNTAFGFDFGAIYRLDEVFPKGKVLRPSVGISVLNIGDLDFEEAGKIPMTVNVGIALNPEIPIINGWTIAVDYVDLLKNFDQDEDNIKRLRIGTQIKLWDNKITDFSVRTGLYQGYLSGGFDFRFTILRLGFTTYAEEIGAYSGQDEDRRYIVSASITW